MTEEKRVYEKEFEITVDDEGRKEHLESLAEAETEIQAATVEWSDTKSENAKKMKELRARRDNHLAAVNQGKCRETIRVYDVISQNGLELHTYAEKDDRLVDSRPLTAEERQMSLSEIMGGKSEDKPAKKRGRPKKDQEAAEETTGDDAA